MDLSGLVVFVSRKNSATITDIMAPRARARNRALSHKSYRDTDRTDAHRGFFDSAASAREDRDVRPTHQLLRLAAHEHVHGPARVLSTALVIASAAGSWPTNGGPKRGKGKG